MTGDGEAARTAQRQMTARRLMRWGELDDRRRRQAGRTPLARISPSVTTAVVSLLFGAEIFRRLGGLGVTAAAGATAAGTFRLWMAVLLAVHVVVLFGAPHRLYWRRDSQVLARLPIPGGALFRLALWRSVRAALRASVPCAVAALAFAVSSDLATVLRLQVLVALAFVAAGLLGPAAALIAGAVVASDRAQNMIKEMGGEFSAPKTSWLGALPGIAGTLLVVAVVALGPWAESGTGAGGRMPLLVIVIAASLGAVGFALARADQVMSAALREVSILDQERLAHIDKSTASPLEVVFARGLLRSPVGRKVAAKDAALSRRRYPSPYFLGPLGVIVLWLVAGFGGDGALSWGAALLYALAAYAALMARRQVSPPIEIPRLLVSLPISPGDAHAAKRVSVLLRAITWVVVGGVPLALVQADPLLGWMVVVTAFAIASVGGVWMLRRGDT